MSVCVCVWKTSDVCFMYIYQINIISCDRWCLYIIIIIIIIIYSSSAKYHSSQSVGLISRESRDFLTLTLV